MKMRIINLVLALCCASMFFSCTSGNKYEGTKKEAYTRNAVIYEVNLRQYTEEGTIQAFSEYLPYLKELGVDILWFMPVHPISELNRKGELGSYYAVQEPHRAVSRHRNWLWYNAQRTHHRQQPLHSCLEHWLSRSLQH